MGTERRDLRAEIPRVVHEISEHLKLYVYLLVDPDTGVRSTWAKGAAPACSNMTAFERRI